MHPVPAVPMRPANQVDAAGPTSHGPRRRKSHQLSFSGETYGLLGCISCGLCTISLTRLGLPKRKTQTQRPCSGCSGEGPHAAAADGPRATERHGPSPHDILETAALGPASIILQLCSRTRKYIYFWPVVSGTVKKARP